ncbi:uncharacterized protein A4U43_C07F33910 [Asparagus officinalis]|uniref:Uncharacterized protein n=1 Tax=Asparagus officinalis TaxID=4686 RepID=A0A5P1EHB8_ASPOF|nr:uncharacterized protein A4U43_C07F33910 [Asparagus officinalis]
MAAKCENLGDRPCRNGHPHGLEMGGVGQRRRAGELATGHRLSTVDVRNKSPSSAMRAAGAFLHKFMWLEDDDIGEESEEMENEKKEKEKKDEKLLIKNRCIDSICYYVIGGDD